MGLAELPGKIQWILIARSPGHLGHGLIRAIEELPGPPRMQGFVVGEWSSSNGRADWPAKSVSAF